MSQLSTRYGPLTLELAAGVRQIAERAVQPVLLASLNTAVMEFDRPPGDGVMVIFAEPSNAEHASPSLYEKWGRVMTEIFGHEQGFLLDLRVTEHDVPIIDADWAQTDATIADILRTAGMFLAVHAGQMRAHGDECADEAFDRALMLNRWAADGVWNAVSVYEFLTHEDPESVAVHWLSSAEASASVPVVSASEQRERELVSSASVTESRLGAPWSWAVPVLAILGSAGVNVGVLTRLGAPALVVALILAAILVMLFASARLFKDLAMRAWTRTVSAQNAPDPATRTVTAFAARTVLR
ncbi:hypothetical protein [Nocardia sp. NPDC004711]